MAVFGTDGGYLRRLDFVERQSSAVISTVHEINFDDQYLRPITTASTTKISDDTWVIAGFVDETPNMAHRHLIRATTTAGDIYDVVMPDTTGIISHVVVDEIVTVTGT